MGEMRSAPVQEQVWRDACLHVGSTWTAWGGAGAGGSTRPFAFARRSQVLVSFLGVQRCAAGCKVLTLLGEVSLWLPREPSRPAQPCLHHASSAVPWPRPAPRGEAAQALAGTVPGPAGSPMGASAAPCCSHKLIHLYRVFARQLTYSLGTNYASSPTTEAETRFPAPSPEGG